MRTSFEHNKKSAARYEIRIALANRFRCVKRRKTADVGAELYKVTIILSNARHYSQASAI